MVVLIAGGTHTGKTLLAQRLLGEHGWPYLCIDHLKMGLIRAGYAGLAPESPQEELTAYLWPVVREIAKTAIENGQDLVLEGCYIPFGWAADFAPEYLPHLRYVCLIFSEAYIENHYGDIVAHENAIEKRLGAGVPKAVLLRENRRNLAGCKKHGCGYILVEDEYRVDYTPV